MSTLTPKAALLPPDDADVDERRPLLEANRDEENNALGANVRSAEKRVWRIVLWVSCSIPMILSFVALGLFVKDFIRSGDLHFDWEGAVKTGINSGLSGAAAMALQVITMMPLRTVMNYQYRHGTTAVEAVLDLYEDGGVLRFYHGFIAALIHGPMSRFGDTASSSGMLFLLESNAFVKSRVPGPVKMMVSSVGAAGYRMVLTPIDTVKTTLQTLGKGGALTLTSRIQGYGIGTLWHGTAATAGASLLGHYPWFGTYNYLDAHLPLPRTELEKVARLAFMGFVASVLSDTLSNSLRVLKSQKQTSETHIRYIDAARAVIAADGWLGLFGRGLKTRLLVNGVQGPMFTVLWNTFQNLFGGPDNGHHHQDNRAQTTEPVSQRSAIASAHPHVKAALSFLLASSLALYRLLVALAFNISKPLLLLSPVPIALYILSPIFTLCSVLFDMLVLMPFKAAVYLLDALYPLYVFCGVACITGCLLGLGGRYLSDALVKKMAAESVPRKSSGGEEELPSSSLSSSSSSSSSSPNPNLYETAMESEKELEE